MTNKIDTTDLQERKVLTNEQMLLILNNPYSIFNAQPLFVIGINDYVEVNKEKSKHIWER